MLPFCGSEFLSDVVFLRNSFRSMCQAEMATATKVIVMPHCSRLGCQIRLPQISSIYLD